MQRQKKNQNGFPIRNGVSIFHNFNQKVTSLLFIRLFWWCYDENRMADVYSKRKRSWIMSLIRGQNTRPELMTRRFLHREGFRFRLHARDLPGSPDIVLPRFRAIVFVNGCFWHGHAKCNRSHLPAQNRSFWKTKIA